MTKHIQVYQAPDLVVTFDPNICRHSGVCLRGSPEVFDISRADWIRPAEASAETVTTVIARCPSGALHAVWAGHPPARG